MCLLYRVSEHDYDGTSRKDAGFPCDKAALVGDRINGSTRIQIPEPGGGGKTFTLKHPYSRLENQ
jgi:hypothetical protein